MSLPIFVLVLVSEKKTIICISWKILDLNAKIRSLLFKPCFEERKGNLNIRLFKLVKMKGAKIKIIFAVLEYEIII